MSRLALVEWMDSNSRYGWVRKDELQEEFAVSCVTIGIIAEESDCVKLIQSTCPKNLNLGNILSIPRCSIKRIRYLGIKREEIK